MAEQDTAKKNYRIWRATPDSDACIAVNEGGAYLVGNTSNFVAADETGISLNGGISFNCLSEQIREGGLFVKMNDFIQMIPSTIVTPIPPHIPMLPTAFPTAILKGLPVFLAALI